MDVSSHASAPAQSITSFKHLRYFPSVTPSILTKMPTVVMFYKWVCAVAPLLLFSS
jgi:hypothetical protein